MMETVVFCNFKYFGFVIAFQNFCKLVVCFSAGKFGKQRSLRVLYVSLPIREILTATFLLSASRLAASEESAATWPILFATK